MLRHAVFGTTHKNSYFIIVFNWWMRMELDFEELIEKIPSIEKIFGGIWILSWIMAIWFYHIQFFLTGVFCLFLVLLVMGYLDKGEEAAKQPISFKMDRSTHSLKVQKIYDEGLKWEENEICSGYCNLPTGEIKEGDVIKNCEGNIALRHVPSNTIMGGFDFKKTK